MKKMPKKNTMYTSPPSVLRAMVRPTGRPTAGLRKTLRKNLLGASASAWMGPRPQSDPRKMPSTPKNMSRLTSRDHRNRLYGFMRLIRRSQPPKTFFCQNWL